MNLEKERRWFYDVTTGDIIIDMEDKEKNEEYVSLLLDFVPGGVL